MPFQRLFITYNGLCVPCCLDAKRQYVVGNAYENTVSDIWHGEKLTKMRELQINGKYRDVDLCRECYLPMSKSSGKATPEIVVSLIAFPSFPPLISYPRGTPNINSLVESACPLLDFIR